MAKKKDDVLEQPTEQAALSEKVSGPGTVLPSENPGEPPSSAPQGGQTLSPEFLEQLMARMEEQSRQIADLQGQLAEQQARREAEQELAREQGAYPRPAEPVPATLGPMSIPEDHEIHRGGQVFQVSLAHLPSVVVRANSPDEAYGKYRRISGVRSSEHEPTIMPVPEETPIGPVGMVKVSENAAPRANLGYHEIGV
jgi:hypothetical protein